MIKMWQAWGVEVSSITEMNEQMIFAGKNDLHGGNHVMLIKSVSKKKQVPFICDSEYVMLYR